MTENQQVSEMVRYYLSSVEKSDRTLLILHDDTNAILFVGGGEVHLHGGESPKDIDVLCRAYMNDRGFRYYRLVTIRDM